jgi:hypothetical protein
MAVVVVVRVSIGVGAMATPPMIMIMIVAVGMRVPPEHKLFNDEEDSESKQQCGANTLSPGGPHTLDCLWKQREQRSAQQRTRCVADEVRHQLAPNVLWHEKKQPRERCAGDATDRGEENDPGKQGHGALCFF